MKKKIVSGSFWLVMAIHIIVFTAIGLFTASGWRLLVIFLLCLLVILLVFWLLKLYAKKHPNNKRLISFISYFSRK
jgi:uncharacterized membrane protein YdjX (TVP38/TMEM64 family)